MIFERNILCSILVALQKYSICLESSKLVQYYIRSHDPAPDSSENCIRLILPYDSIIWAAGPPLDCCPWLYLMLFHAEIFYCNSGTGVCPIWFNAMTHFGPIRSWPWSTFLDRGHVATGPPRNCTELCPASHLPSAHASPSKSFQPTAQFMGRHGRFIVLLPAGSQHRPPPLDPLP